MFWLNQALLHFVYGCFKKIKKNQKKLLYLLAVDISSGRRQIEVAILSVDSVYNLNLSCLYI